MATVTHRNILVGHGNLYIAPYGTALPAFQTTGTTPVPIDPDTAFENDATWNGVGATQEGVEIGYDPDYGEVEVDQMKDAAIMFNQGVTVTMNTNLAEATLANLQTAWGADDLTVNGDTETFNIAVPSEEPIERAGAVVGRAPRTAAGAARKRVYHARRIISVEGSTHALRTSEATIFPVTFRLLADGGFPGSEYGTIVDRLTG